MTACAFCGGDPEAAVAGRWEFFIERSASSLNDRLANVGAKRWAYARERGEWLQWAQLARINGRIAKAKGKRRVVMTRFFGGRQRPFDYINLVGGAKSLVDALVLAELLVDDTPAQLEDHYRQLWHEAKSGVHIVIEEIA
jgi:hypothetical protein